MLAKNQQTATAIATPAAMILGFTPMIAGFNEAVERVASVLYTQQLNVIVNGFSSNFPKALAVIGANILVLLILFVFAYRKKGLLR
jgi:ABC-2 type transport system permease protein